MTSPGDFMIFSPLKTPLTYEQVLFPSHETHTVTYKVEPYSCMITPGSIIAGVDKENKETPFVCFAYFMNGAEELKTIPMMSLMNNAQSILIHFNLIANAMREKINWPATRPSFKTTVKLVDNSALPDTMPSSAGTKRAKMENK